MDQHHHGSGPLHSTASSKLSNTDHFCTIPMSTAHSQPDGSPSRKELELEAMVQSLQKQVTVHDNCHLMMVLNL